MAFLLRGWVWPAPTDWPVLAVLGVASGLGGFLLGHAYRLCEAGLAAQFEYVALPMSVFWGLAVFGEWPDTVGWVGIGMIVTGGLYMIWRESVAARRSGVSDASR